jgi:hypothetical protein
MADRGLRDVVIHIGEIVGPDDFPLNKWLARQLAPSIRRAAAAAKTAGAPSRASDEQPTMRDARDTRASREIGARVSISLDIIFWNVATRSSVRAECRLRAAT